MGFDHIPVLLAECIDNLAIQSDGTYLDGTAGGAGHSKEIAKKLTSGHLYSLDQDPDAIAAATARLAGLPATVLQNNFRYANDALAGVGVTALDGALLDLGVSSHQLDEIERGFSYQGDAPLDMRMSQSGPTAADLVNSETRDN
ncbi:MAG: 16S rRNA (cytosine(1402)-N(4))-methyltransferase, partial [Ruthenibacterium sp.]